MTDETEILIQAERWRRAGAGVTLATVVETFGSAPRPRGAHLVVDDVGRFIGSFSHRTARRRAPARESRAISSTSNRTLLAGRRRMTGDEI